MYRDFFFFAFVCGCVHTCWHVYYSGAGEVLVLPANGIEMVIRAN